MGIHCKRCDHQIDTIDRYQSIYCPVCHLHLSGPYEYNKKDWNVGDLVIHYADYKSVELIMQIVGIKQEENGNRLYLSKYISLSGENREYCNYKKYLLDPNDFDLMKYISKQS